MPVPDTIDYKELYEQTLQENILLREEFKQLRAINEQLLHRVEQLLKLSFGSKSERYLGKEQMSEQLRVELSPEVVVEVPVPQMAKSEVTKQQEPDKEKKNTL